MKKLLLFLSIFTLFVTANVVYADEECNSYYKIHLNIEGNGTVSDKFSEKSYTKDTTINVKCKDHFVFEVKPDNDYEIQGVYIDGNHLTSNNNAFSITDVMSNTNLKVVFSKSDIVAENEMVFSSYEDNISLYIADLKEELNNNTVFKLLLKEITIVLDNEFIKNSKDNITIVANEIYKKDLNLKEQKAAKTSTMYDINVYSGGKLINDFKGTATITIPFSKGDKAYVYRVLNNGKLSQVKSSYSNGKVSFKVNQLGTFALSKDKLDELGYVRSVINLNNKQKIAILSIGLALALLAVFVKIRKRK